MYKLSIAALAGLMLLSGNAQANGFSNSYCAKAYERIKADNQELREVLPRYQIKQKRLGRVSKKIDDWDLVKRAFLPAFDNYQGILQAHCDFPYGNNINPKAVKREVAKFRKINANFWRLRKIHPGSNLNK